jgi:hypothetical protein
MLNMGTIHYIHGVCLNGKTCLRKARQVWFRMLRIPVHATSDKQVQARATILKDTRITTLRISEGSAHSVVHDILGSHKVCAQWVPRELRNEHKHNCVGIIFHLLECYRNKFMKRCSHLERLCLTILNLILLYLVRKPFRICNCKFSTIKHTSRPYIFILPSVWTSKGASQTSVCRWWWGEGSGAWLALHSTWTSLHQQKVCSQLMTVLSKETIKEIQLYPSILNSLVGGKNRRRKFFNRLYINKWVT